MGTEIAVTLEIMNAYLLGVGHTVAIAVAEIFQPNGTFRIILAEKVTVLVLVASGNQLFQSQLLKVVAEIMEKIAYTRVIAITEYRFAFKMCFVMSQFVLYINKLCVKLVFFALFAACRLMFPAIVIDTIVHSINHGEKEVRASYHLPR